MTAAGIAWAVLSALGWFVVAVAFVGVLTVLVAVVSHRSIHARITRQPRNLEATLDVEDEPDDEITDEQHDVGE